VSLAQAVLFGLLQGLTEFLPVSSSGHLVLLRYLFGLRPPGAFLEAVVHLGTLVSVVAVYAPQWLRLLESLAGPDKRVGWRTVGAVVLASLPAAGLGLGASAALEAAFGRVDGTAWGWIATTCLLASLWFAPRVHRDAAPAAWSGTRPKRFPAPGALQSLWVGTFQALALLPGVSRSGATIVAARWAGLSPEDSAAFSFLLSVPAVAGASLWELTQHAQAAAATVSGRAVLTAGLVAAASGYAALRLVLRIVTRERLWLFAPYTLLLALVALAMLPVRS